MIKETSLALNTRNWLPKEGESVDRARNRATHDFAAASIEQRKAPPEERINTFIYILGKDGQLYDKETGEKPTLRWATETDHLENHAFQIMELWAREGSSENLAWFSPPDDKHGYTEARLVVSKIEKEKEEISIICRAFCLPYSKDECIDLAKEIAVTSTENTTHINSGDTLRAFPIFFNPPNNLAWYEYLEEKIKEPNIWKKVKSGDDYRNKREALRLSRPVIEKHFDLIVATESAYGYVLAGALMEREIAMSGVIFQARGSCGMSNQEALGGFKNNSGIFDTVFSSAATSNHESSFSCPSCHKAIPSGLGITVCPHCGAKKEDYGKCV
ncbi:hypothetical protein KKH23_02390 [Patescibacteria group bacterium]|nr:hypothetical protein [Patescibacteria group bacterium]MBU0777388.1 hypothetical protein [Patescibacteria group bacterium]MBU0846024.1 hypothetical protein [Patescibacteria group bacterium]MBU0922476.1 hypothetical protein [Patescibacteria group bacterium]MBU1066791.1 hypothetical protein [Patescibacteria group bacterium]